MDLEEVYYDKAYLEEMEKHRFRAGKERARELRIENAFNSHSFNNPFEVFQIKLDKVF